MSQPENQATVANLTEEEATRYDRQMRLWGIEAQQRYIYLSATFRKNHLLVMQDEECFNSGSEARRLSHGSH